jgi:hypothetical protein
MAHTVYKYKWSPQAKELLGLRDRFTRAAIQKDFESHPEQDMVTLDAVEALYATPVADNRYTVIWKAMTDNLAEVKAVVASQLRGESGADLKTKLEKVVAVESNGQFKLY